MKKLSVLVSLVAAATMLANQQAYAQAAFAPLETFAINRAEASLLTYIAKARGIAATDPRIAATLSAMSNVSTTTLNIASTAVTAAMAFAGAPVWLTVVAGLGVVAAGSMLMVGGTLFQWSADGKSVSVTQPTPPLPAYSGPLYQGSGPVSGAMQRPFDYGASLGMQVYRTVGCQATDSSCANLPMLPTTGNLNFKREFGSLALVAATISQVQSYDLYEQQYGCAGGVVGGGTATSGIGCDVVGVSVYWQPNASYTTYTLTESRSLTTWKSDANGNPYKSTDTSIQPATWWLPGPGLAPVVATDLSTVYPQMAASSLGKPLDPMFMATLVNDTWQRAAAQPGYAGLPYSVTAPVTATDAQGWSTAAPMDVPTVGDLFTPAASAGSTVVIGTGVYPGATSGTGTASGGSGSTVGSSQQVSVINTPNVNVVNRVSVDLGADPTVQSPTLESTPTISMILSPVMDLLPDLKHWAVPAHGSACPQPSFSVLGHSFSLTAQCDLAESNRTAIYTAFAAMFTLAALFVVLRA